MSLTQFTMVEELAFLIKDNLPCKHLVLSLEDAFVDFLENDVSSNGTLELEPMNPYNRLLLHRLADIFGFSHQSVGEGDERHLVLECCPETSIPSILVSDLLWQYDEYQSPTASHILSRGEEASQKLKVERPNSQISFEEREAAYLAARQRIFAADEGGAVETVKQKPRSNPLVARRMIAHALGQRIKATDKLTHSNKDYQNHIDETNIQVEKNGESNLVLETLEDMQPPSSEKHSQGKPMFSLSNGHVSSDADRQVTAKVDDKIATHISLSGKSSVQKANLKDEHFGAAKRMFAHALGYPSARENIFPKRNEIKQTNRRKAK